MSKTRLRWATHQMANNSEGSLTTNQGVVVADNQNTLKSGERGPSLLEDFHFREKITNHQPLSVYAPPGRRAERRLRWVATFLPGHIGSSAFFQHKIDVR
jgi:hypothetical protein